MTDLPKIDSEGLRLAKAEGAESVSSTARVSLGTPPMTEASKAERALVDVTRKLRTALDAMRPFPLVVEAVAAGLIAEADAAIADALSARTYRKAGEGGQPTPSPRAGMRTAK